MAALERVSASLNSLIHSSPFTCLLPRLVMKGSSVWFFACHVRSFQDDQGEHSATAKQTIDAMRRAQRERDGVENEINMKTGKEQKHTPHLGLVLNNVLERFQRDKKRQKERQIGPR